MTTSTLQLRAPQGETIQSDTDTLAPNTVLIDGQAYRSDNLRGVALTVSQALAQAGRELDHWTITDSGGWSYEKPTKQKQCEAIRKQKRDRRRRRIAELLEIDPRCTRCGRELELVTDSREANRNPNTAHLLNDELACRRCANRAHTDAANGIPAGEVFSHFRSAKA